LLVAFREQEGHDSSVARSLVEQSLDQLLSMASAAGCLLPENRADSAHAHRPLIEDRRKVVLCGAGEHVAAIDQRESSPMTTSPDGSLLGSVKRAIRVPAQAAIRERMRCVQDALENDTFGWDDRRHTTDY